MKIGQRIGQSFGQTIGQLRNDLGPSSDAHPDASQRGARRNRGAAITGGTAVLARAVQVSTSLITIPLTVHYLGNERFGLWMTISSVFAMANFADFGIGNGVLNTVADAFGKNDFDRIRAAISSGFAVLGAVGLLLLGLFASTFAWVSWADVFRVTSAQARAETAPALMVFACCFALNIPLDLVQRAQLGLQQGFRMNLWQVGGSLAGLAGVIAGIRMHSSLPLLVAALAGAPVAAAAFNTFHFFVVSRPDLRPRRRFVSRDAISRIVTFGTLFFVLQLVAAVAFSADNIIIARTLGASSVPDYSIPQRMFSLISLMVAMLATPLWPAYGEAISRGDIPWVRRTLKRSFVLAFSFSAVASITMLLIARRLLAWWIGPRISPPFVLLLGLALWTIVECCGTTIAMFLSGASIALSDRRGLHLRNNVPRHQGLPHQPLWHCCCSVGNPDRLSLARHASLRVLRPPRPETSARCAQSGHHRHSGCRGLTGRGLTGRGLTGRRPRMARIPQSGSALKRRPTLLVPFDSVS